MPREAWGPRQSRRRRPSSGVKRRHGCETTCDGRREWEARWHCPRSATRRRKGEPTRRREWQTAGRYHRWGAASACGREWRNGQAAALTRCYRAVWLVILLFEQGERSGWTYEGPCPVETGPARHLGVAFRGRAVEAHLQAVSVIASCHPRGHLIGS